MIGGQTRYCKFCNHRVRLEAMSIGSLEVTNIIDDQDKSETYGQIISSCPGCAYTPKDRIWMKTKSELAGEPGGKIR